MDKKVHDELAAKGVPETDIGDGAKTINDLETAGIGPDQVSEETFNEVIEEVQQQGTFDQVNDDSNATYAD